VLILNGMLSARFGVAIALVGIAALLLTGLIGVFHAGVEWGWWEGPTACSGLGFDPAALDNPDAFRVVRCDVAAWRLAGISMAGYNALISFGTACLCTALLTRRR
jgi:disulfide bond formation protein DsbB